MRDVILAFATLLVGSMCVAAALNQLSIGNTWYAVALLMLMLASCLPILKLSLDKLSAHDKG